MKLREMKLRVRDLSEAERATIAAWCGTQAGSDRLQAYLNEERGLVIKRSRINELLVAEGLRWRTDETWFGDRVDPKFAEKRGPASRSTPPRLQPV